MSQSELAHTDRMQRRTHSLTDRKSHSPITDGTHFPPQNRKIKIFPRTRLTQCHCHCQHTTQHSTEMDDSTHAGSTHKCCRPRPVTPLCFTVTGMDTGTPCVESSLHQINRSTGAAGGREDSGRGKHTHSIMQCTRAHIVPKSGSHRRSRPTNKKFRQCIRGNPVESFEEQRRWVSKV